MGLKMPRGGARPGAGRPKGSANRRTREIADEAASSGNVLPLSYLLDVLNNPTSTRAEKLHAASIACPFVHPRLNAVSVSSNFSGVGGGGGGGDVSITQIFAVPRGAALDVRDGKVTIEGTATELSPISPYEGTPGLLTDQSVQPAPAERLPVIEVDTTNVMPMRRRDEP
jgi:hypothetical protein